MTVPPKTAGSTVRSGESAAFASGAPLPGLALAWTRRGASPTDRARIGDSLTIGRSARAAWTIGDDRMSSIHLRLRPFGATALVEDAGSTNGTFVDGERIDAARAIGPGAVVRAGHSIFVFEPDLVALEAAESPPAELAGRFHGPRIARALALAAETGRHVLLAGESGTGKEIAAAWLGRRAGGPFVAHNCARFASVEEAETTLFGVARGVFSGVEARSGLLEDAHGGALFLDEIHALPLRVQQSLLRFVEDGRHTRIGAATERQLSVRLVFATNLAPEAPEIAPDLVARLGVVTMPPLSERRADVPDIFAHVLARAAGERGVDPAGWLDVLGGDHFEALCLADLAGKNVRALEALAEEILAIGRSGADPVAAVRRAFAERLGDSPVVRRAVGASEDDDSLYERHRDRIVRAYQAADGNLTETERALRGSGLRVNRRWLTEFLRRWGIRPGRAAD